MRGEVLIPFVAQLNGRKFRGSAGDIIELPPSVDWVQAGLVRELAEEPEAPKPKREKTDGPKAGNKPGK